MTERLRIDLTDYEGRQWRIRLISSLPTPASWTNAGRPVPVLTEAEEAGIRIRSGERSDELVPVLRRLTVDLSIMPIPVGSSDRAMIVDLLDELITSPPYSWMLELARYNSATGLYELDLLRAYVLPDSIDFARYVRDGAFELSAQDVPSAFLEAPHTLPASTTLSLRQVFEAMLSDWGYGDFDLELVSDWRPSALALTADLLSIQLSTNAFFTVEAQETADAVYTSPPRAIGRDGWRNRRRGRRGQYRVSAPQPLGWNEVLESLLGALGLEMRQRPGGRFTLREPGTILRGIRKTTPTITV